MKAKTRKVKPSRVTHIAVSALYNRGNYENVKYEIGADVPRGGSPKSTLLELVEIVASLKPVRKDYDTEKALEVLAKKPDERSEYEKTHLAEFTEKVALYNGLKTRRDNALKMLENLGATITHQDGKSDWNNDQPF